MRALLLRAAAALAVLAVAPAGASNYVAAAAPAGASSSNYVADCADPGALTQARDAIRAERLNPTQPVTVAIRGTCRLSAPLELAGVVDSHVRWEGGTISGGVEVSGWRKASEAPCAGCGAIWIADLAAGTAAARQLWADGVRANRTQMRYPQTSLPKTKFDPKIYKLHTTIGANWTRADAIEMVYGGHDFCLGAALKQPSSVRML